MRITGISEQKRSKDRFSVYVDEKYSFSITTDDLLLEKLRVGADLSSNDVERLKAKSSDSLIAARAYEKCLRRPHSEREIRDYLRNKKASQELIESIILKCYKHKLLDDNLFAERWVAHRKASHKSNRFISSESRGKGVDPEIIAKALAESSDDQQQLRQQIAKKRSKYNDHRKLVAYLQRQGFSYSDIASELKTEED